MSTSNTTTLSFWPAALVAAALLTSPAPALAAKLIVEGYGVDGPGCGTKAEPCRSISYAIGLAADGDQIVVGPGRYGDLDADGVFEPVDGEEAGEPGAGCFCMIKIDKSITVSSSSGAAATILDGNDIAALNVVQIAADDVVFGRPKRGFTITGAGFSGLEIISGFSRAQVTANVSVANSNDGFFFVFGGNEHVFRGNFAHNNGSSGFEFSGQGHRLSDNAATGNGNEGFTFGGAANELKANLAASNGAQGFEVAGPDHRLTKSSAIGNGLEGVRVIAGGMGAGAVQVSDGNVYGNWLTGGGGLNCGISNDSGADVAAGDMFWGAAAGPGADPADTTCGADVITVDPVATKPAKTKIQP